LKILVTGATGFIGNHLVQHLLKKDVEVIATSRSVEKAKQYQWFSKVKYIPCDFEKEQEDYFSFFKRPECIIHLAWDGLWDYKNLLHFEKNVPVHYKFIKNMVHHGLKHVVITGTCLEYGMQYGQLTEDLETKPSTPYGLGKDTLRRYLEQLLTLSSVTFQWIRLFYLYGDGQSEKSLLSQLKQAVQSGEKEFNMSGGEQLRDYLPVEEVAAYIGAIALQKQIQGIINCCSGTPISIRQFVEMYVRKRGYSIQLNFGYYSYPDYEPLAFWGDNSKLQAILCEK
jgi:nucleoside-diphosphate-sugar epimerase